MWYGAYYCRAYVAPKAGVAPRAPGGLGRRRLQLMNAGGGVGLTSAVFDPELAPHQLDVRRICVGVATGGWIWYRVAGLVADTVDAQLMT